MILTTILATGTTLVALAISLISIIFIYIIRFKRNMSRFTKSYDEILLDEYGYVERITKKLSPELDEGIPARASRNVIRDERIAKKSDLLQVEFELILDNQANSNHEKILPLMDDCLFSLKKVEKGVQTCQSQRRVLEEKYTLMESTVRVLTGMKDVKDMKSKSIYKFVTKSIIGAIILIAAFYILVFTDLSESLKSSTIALITTVAGFLLGKFT